MTFAELRNAFLNGRIEKKLYWQETRENYTILLPQLLEVVKDNSEIANITIDKSGVILTNSNEMKHYFFFDETFCRAEAELAGSGDYEKEDMNVVVSYLNKTGGRNVFDIGANAGLYSLNLYYELNGGEYTMFEPLTTTFEKLKKNLKLNNVDMALFHPVNMGISDKEGTFDFYMPGASEAASLEPVNDEFYLKNSDDEGNYIGSSQMKKVRCKVTTLDEYVGTNKPANIDFIKIDVEGNEKFVLNGAYNTLKTYRPLVYSELLRKHCKRFGYHPNEVIAYMREFDYNCFTIHNGCITEIAEINDDTEETNFFFATDEQRYSLK